MRKQTKVAAVLSAAALLALGASMTSFAATKGWTQEDGEWVYLNSSGERAVETWKRSGENYYWLDENGLIAKNQIIEQEGNYYYVNESGVRLTNQWVSVENTDDVTVDNKDVNTLWYYLGTTGRAYRADNTSIYKNTLIDGRRYFFDEYGHMVTGWLINGNDTYYLGEENEGVAVTGWKFLEIPEDIESGYDVDEAWFYFGANGKARKATRVYISNAYYAFDDNGVMLDDWQVNTPVNVMTPGNVGLAATQSAAFYNLEVGNQGSGWVHTYQYADEGGDVYWYYMESSNKNGVFNYGGKDAYTDAQTGNNHVTVEKYKSGYLSDGAGDYYAAKVIKGKTYLFDKDGKMATGVYKFNGKVRVGDTGGYLDIGLYYFDTAKGASEGRMVTSRRTTITYSDGESYTYYFNRAGEAVRMAVNEGSVYDGYGVRIEAEDGNANMLVDIADIVANKSNGVSSTLTLLNQKRYNQGTFIVSSNGKIRTGRVTIDDVIYTINGNGVVVDAVDKNNQSQHLTGRFVETAPLN